MVVFAGNNPPYILARVFAPLLKLLSFLPAWPPRTRPLTHQQVNDGLLWDGEGEAAGHTTHITPCIQYVVKHLLKGDT